MEAGLSATLALLAAAAQPATPEIDRIRLAPPTGIYVETDYREAQQDPACDWYASAETLLEASPDERPTTPRGCKVAVRLRGVLNQAGADRFDALTELLDSEDGVPTRVVLNSRGGDAAAALRIAQRIRNHPLYRRADGGVATVIDPSHTAVCFSACLIVFAAGFERHAEFGIDGDAELPSRLGIHSPAHFDRDRSSYDTAHDNRNIQLVRRRLVDFFRSVDVDARIVDDMFAVPFDRIHLLTRAEAQGYRLVD